MKIVNLKQGTPEWLEFRANHHTASQAPAMMGISPYQSRSELLRQKWDGHKPDVSPAQQRVFDKGHHAEARMRPVIEDILGEPLFPATVVDDDDYLSASLDGMTADGRIIWEHKQFNRQKFDHIKATECCPEEDFPQVQQQLLVSGASKCLYSVGDNPEHYAYCWVTLHQGAVEDIQAGWEQFDRDLADYTPPKAAAPVVAATIENMPYLSIQVHGEVTASTLPQFREHALRVFDNINTDLSTDQDFADAEATVRWCKQVEDKIQDAKDQALSSTSSIEELFRTLDDLANAARDKRLHLNKLVQQRKNEIRQSLVIDATDKLDAHMHSLSQELGCKVPVPQVRFADALKGKRSLSSMQDAVDQMLADAKIAANKTADTMSTNLAAFDQYRNGYNHLFRDLDALLLKDPSDFADLCKLRVLEAEKAEAERKRQAEQAAAEQAHPPQADTPADEPPPKRPREPYVSIPSLRWEVSVRFLTSEDMRKENVADAFARRYGIDRDAIINVAP